MQVDVYRADFNQERRDREKAVGQVDSLKKELEKTKQKLKEIHKVCTWDSHSNFKIVTITCMQRFIPLVQNYVHA